MQHTIKRGSTTAAGHTVDAVKSLFDEVKTRKDSQLEVFSDPMFCDETMSIGL